MLARSRLQRYRADVDIAAEQASEFVAAYIEAFRAEYPGASVAEIRDLATQAITDSLNVFGDQAAELSCELFDEIAEESESVKRSRIYDGLVGGDMVDGRVRYLAKSLVTGDYDGFDRSIRDVTKYYVKRSALENMVRNCSANEVRYARVTTGLETCAFCFMLSTRGFVYHTEVTALGLHGYHQHCDCVAVPGFRNGDEDSQIEGYMPSEMRKRYRMCAEAVDVNGARALDPEYRKKVLKEVATRDWKWLYSGTEPAVTREIGAKPPEKEKKVASLLAQHGFQVEFLKEINQTSVKTADARLCGSVFEFKVPEGWNGEHTVRKQFYKAAGKGTDKLLISCTENEAKLPELRRWVLETFRKGDFEYIKEVLIVSSDGSRIERLTR